MSHTEMMDQMRHGDSFYFFYVLCYSAIRPSIRRTVCLSITSLLHNCKSVFQNHFIFGHKIYWGMVVDAIEIQHHSSLNMHIMTQ